MDYIQNGIKLLVNHQDLYNLLLDIFDLAEARKKVGETKGILFEVRTKEMGHYIPHVHAEYQGEYISISLVDCSVLAGNIPNEKKAIAVAYVKNNREKILNEWVDIHGTTYLPDMYAKKHW